MADATVSVRYMVDDVDQAIDFYTRHFGFESGPTASPAFAEVRKGNLRLLLAGPNSSAGRPMPDGRTPEPGGWNRIHFVVDGPVFVRSSWRIRRATRSRSSSPRTDSSSREVSRRGRRSSTGDRTRSARHDRRGSRAGSGRARGSRSRCTP